MLIFEIQLCPISFSNALLGINCGTALVFVGEESHEHEKKKWGTYQRLGRNASTLTSIPLFGAEVSLEEIRSAASLYPKPPSIPGDLVSVPELDPQLGAIVGHGVTEGGLGGNPLIGRPILDELDIRELLLDHVNHHFCWGSRPARTWKIQAVEDCNVYVGTLETFIEERETITQKEPYHGGKVDGKASGAEPDTWELDLTSEFPLLFVSQKEIRVRVPHSEAVEKCTGCAGRGDIVCPTCNVDQEPGIYKENQMTVCSSCHGRGLIAHKDGSDTICVKCNGKGMLPCVTCNSRGLLKCETCQGEGSLLTRNIVIVRWRTLSTKKVSASRGAASVPDEVFHRAKGVQLCNTQAYHCTPAFFADSYFLNNFSSEVISERAQVPPSARVICERHIITVVPVTRIIMAHRSRSFGFYLIGTSREVYIKDYPYKWCWGLCPCFSWLRLF
ncbi:hypothetical protein AMTR_s00029p00195210 [Amborella trichopoda]|uniref:CR-type domain-containing protein n=2 Tax=Amborella trichopoda TaxID=13333 RepID=W1PPB0_AMBTC|nr:hypothetical protein AMTR_s00029p00195210 [Amborella trichopoda]